MISKDELKQRLLTKSNFTNGLEEYEKNGYKSAHVNDLLSEKFEEWVELLRMTKGMLNNADFKLFINDYYPSNEKQS